MAFARPALASAARRDLASLPTAEVRAIYNCERTLLATTWLLWGGVAFQALLTVTPFLGIRLPGPLAETSIPGEPGDAAAVLGALTVLCAVIAYACMRRHPWGRAAALLVCLLSFSTLISLCVAWVLYRAKDHFGPNRWSLQQLERELALRERGGR